MAKIHFILQAKGGVGKSMISSLLAQHKLEKGENITCIDTDPLNASFSAYKALNVTHLKLLEDEQINARNFDKLIEIISSVEHDVIIDNGASSFFPLSHYLISNEIPELLKSMGHTTVIHTVITAGQALLDTLNGLNSLVKSFGVSSEFVVWLNPFWGNIEYNGKSFTEMAVYKNNKSSIDTIIELPKLAQDTFGIDLSEMLKNKQTFAEGISDESNSIMTRQRLKIIKSKIDLLLNQAGYDMRAEIEQDDLQELENLLSEIARKNGVIVGKDDPIAIAFIFNQYLLKQTKNNQNILIQNLKSDIEEIILKTLHSSNSLIEKSQDTSLKLVNEHISKSKTAISNAIGEASEEFESKNEKLITKTENNISYILEKIASIRNALYILSGVNIIIFLLTIFGNFIK